MQIRRRRENVQINKYNKREVQKHTDKAAKNERLNLA